MAAMSDPWRKCSTCKADIDFKSTYWVCNVSTCNRRPLELVFCSVDCWDAHVPTMRHKESWAEERTSPERGAAAAPDKSKPRDSQPEKKRIDMRSEPKKAPAASAPSLKLDPAPPDEVLVVASKVKAYIKARSGMNTAGSVMDELSNHVRRVCDKAIKSAAQHERKTVLDRDVP
jgi:hypothetical protein